MTRKDAAERKVLARFVRQIVRLSVAEVGFLDNQACSELSRVRQRIADEVAYSITTDIAMREIRRIIG